MDTLYIASIALPLALLLWATALYLLSKHLDQLRQGGEFAHPVSLSENMANSLHFALTNTHRLIASFFFRIVVAVLSWFVPKFRQWTLGAENKLMRLIDYVKGKRDLGNRDSTKTSLYLRDIREYSDKSRKKGREIV